jgi:HK97 family phage portal protein
VGIVKTARDFVVKSLGGTIPLTETQRATIFRYFGGLMPLNIGNNSTSQITEGYLRNVDVYAIVKKVTDISKSLPWIVEKRQYNGNWKQLEDTTIHELMNAPNVMKSYTWDDIEEQVLLYLLITGNVYLVGNTQFNSTLIEEVDVLPSQAVNIFNRNSSFFIPDYEYQFNLGSSNRIYKGSELKHIKFYNPNINLLYYGLSPIQVAGNVVTLGNERWTAGASMFANGGAKGFITDKSNDPMTPEEFERIDEALKSKIGGADKYNKLVATNKDLGFVQIGMSSTDLQMIENGQVTTRALCNVLGLDSSLFNDPENKTYNNRLEAEKAMYTNCIIPLSDKLSEAYTQYICKNHFPNETVRMRQDFSKVECLQENLKEKSEILGSFKDKGIYTANEVREKMNMPKSADPNADLLIINTTILQNMQKQNNNLQ